MAEERTEELALAGQLPIKVGGDTVVLRVLSIEESDEWQRTLGATVAGFDVPDEDDGGAFLGKLLVAGAEAKLEMVLAYDVDHRLGSREDVRKRMTKAQLAAAFDSMLDAENPKEEAANRSVAEAFGRPNLMVRVGLTAASGAFPTASSTNGRSPTGDSTPKLSVVASRGNGSSSSGGTAKSGRTANSAKRS